MRSRLMSDVPLGMFLSGGVDSSAIAAITKRLTGGPVETFSVGYGEEQYSELSYAASVADVIGTDHHEVRVGLEDFFNILPRLIWQEDEPITWPSSVSLHFLSQLAAERVKVVLTGEGSDELFGGYERYRWNLLNTRGASLFNRRLRRCAARCGTSLSIQTSCAPACAASCRIRSWGVSRISSLCSSITSIVRSA